MASADTRCLVLAVRWDADGEAEGNEEAMMERHHPPLFEHARTVIESVLAEFGFSLAEEHYHQRSFGSAITVYSRRGGELRLIWDGKEGTLSADYGSSAHLESRIDWLGPSVRTPEEIHLLTDALVTQFGSAGRRDL